MGQQVIVINAGQTAVIPANATITALVITGDAQVSSTCDNLPEPTEYKCWKFLWESTDQDTAHDDAYFTGINIGGTTYNLAGISSAEVNTYDNGADYLASVLPLVLPAGLATGIVSGGGEATDPKCLVIQIPETLDSPALYWSNPGFESGAFFPIEGDCDCS